MKVGFSYGRCIRDIVNGTVDYDDVLLVYTATRVESDEHIEKMVDSYMWRNDYLMGLDRDACVEVAKRLYANGKIHQPRLFGRGRSKNPESGVWMDLAPTVTGADQQNEVVQKAWRAYQMALKLASPEALPEDQFRKRTPEEEDEYRKALDLLAGAI